MLRTLALLLALSLSSNVASAKDFLIPSYNPTSDRAAALDDNGEVAYLYLSKPGTQDPEKKAVAYSHGPLAAKGDPAATREAGEPQPLRQEVASPTAIVANPIESEFSLKWSADGQTVALLRQGKPIAFVAASDPFGYSKAVAKPSPLANPWDQKRYESIFGK